MCVFMLFNSCLRKLKMPHVRIFTQLSNNIRKILKQYTKAHDDFKNALKFPTRDY